MQQLCFHVKKEWDNARVLCDTKSDSVESVKRFLERYKHNSVTILDYLSFLIATLFSTVLVAVWH